METAFLPLERSRAAGGEVVPARGRVSSPTSLGGGVEGKLCGLIGWSWRSPAGSTAWSRRRSSPGRARAGRDPASGRRGWLRRIHRGVYLVGPLETPHTSAMAAVLAVGDGALLSHYPAAVLWGLRPARAEPMHVTVVAATSAADGFTVHRVAHLHPHDATRKHGIPVTSPARTLLDLATTTATKTSTGPRTKPTSTTSSQTFPSMSSSAVTQGTGEPRH